ncbi:oligosaccharide flippase family protein [Pseudomonas sp. abacavir_1]
MSKGLQREGDSSSGWEAPLRAAWLGTLLKLLSAATAFCSSIVFARALGASEFGVYSFVNAWVSLLAILAGLGFPQYLIREGVRAPHSLGWMRVFADHRTFLCGGGCGLILIIFSTFALPGFDKNIFLAAAPLPLLLGLGSVRQALLQTQGWLVRSQWPSLLLIPATSFLLCSALWLLQGMVSASQLMSISTISAAMALCVNHLQLRQALSPNAKQEVAALRVGQAFPFMLLACTYFLSSRIDLIMLGINSKPQELGIYSVSSRAAELLVFLSMASVTAVAPSFARLLASGKKNELQSLVTSLGRRLTLLTVPPALIMFIFASQLVPLIYGHSYAEGATILQILVVAQLIAVLGGPLGTLLNMSGNEKSHLFGVMSGVLLNVLLNTLLAPYYGGIGAAVATCSSILFSRIILLLQVRRRLDIRPTVLGV